MRRACCSPGVKYVLRGTDLQRSITAGVLLPVITKIQPAFVFEMSFQSGIGFVKRIHTYLCYFNIKLINIFS